MQSKVLTIDLKSRSFKDSIILDLSNISNKKHFILNLDIKTSLCKIREFLKDGNLQCAKNELETIKFYLQDNKDSDFFKEYNMYNEACSNLMDAIKELDENKDELDKFLNLSSIFHKLIIFKVYNDISYFEEFYDECLIKVEKYVQSYDLLKILLELKKQLEVGEKTSYIMETTDKLEQTYIYKDSEKNELQNLKNAINELREDKIKTYNQGSKNDKLGIAKFLMPYRYRKIVKDVKFDQYAKMLQPTYNNYTEMENNIYEMYKLYRLNKSNTYEEFYKIVIKFRYVLELKLSEYASYYIIKRLFEKNKNYYTIKDLQTDIFEIMKLLKIKKNTNIIPV